MAAATVAAKEAWYNQCRLYHQLRHCKSAEFWCRKIDDDQADQWSLWKSVDSLLGRACIPANDVIDVEICNRFFDEKVSKVRSSMSDATPPTFSRIQPDASFAAFSSVNVDDDIDAVQQLPDKLLATDPMPTSVLKQVVHLVAHYFTQLFNTHWLPATFRLRTRKGSSQ